MAWFLLVVVGHKLVSCITDIGKRQNLFWLMKK